MVSGHFIVNLDTAPVYWHLNAPHLSWLSTKEGEGAHSLSYTTAPPHFETPYHLHHDEDEAFYLLDGELTVVLDGENNVAGPGSYIFLHRGVPHGFLSSSDRDSHVLTHAIPDARSALWQ